MEALDDRRGWAEGTRLGERFKLLRRLGAGGMGEVWAALDHRLGRRVALKRLLPEATRATSMARLEREARTQAGLASAHIATVHGLERVDHEGTSEVVLVLELVEGQSVADMLEERGPLEIELALSLFAQLCLALRVAHAAGVVHRDLKPANLLVRSDGTLVVVDFGIAWRPGSADESLTMTGAVIGSTAYVSPQQASGERVGPESDIWSAGATLYEMLTGERPFQGASPAETIAAILRDSPPPLRRARPDVPSHVARLVERCLSKSPEDRPADALEMLDAIPNIPIPIAGRRGVVFEPELLARGIAHPPLPQRGRHAAIACALLGMVLMYVASSYGWAHEGTWVPLEETRSRSVTLLERLGLDDAAAHDAVGYDSDAAGHVETWYRARGEPLYGTQLRPLLDHPTPVYGEVLLVYDSSGRLRRFDWHPGSRAASQDLSAILHEQMGLPLGLAFAERAGELERGELVRYAELDGFRVERVGDGARVLRLERFDHEPLRLHQRNDLHRGKPIGIVLLVVTVGMVVLQWRRGRGDRRGAFLVAGLSLALEMARLLLQPMLWIDGGWRDLLQSAVARAALCWLIYYGAEPVVRRNWPGLLVGWERLIRWRARDPVLGRELLLGCAALLPFAGALLLERALLGHVAAPLRELFVPFVGDVGDWIGGGAGIVGLSIATVLVALSVSALAHYVVRIAWLSLAIGMGLGAVSAANVVAHGSVLLSVITLILMVALAHRGGMVALVAFIDLAMGLSTFVPPRAGGEVALYGASPAIGALVVLGASAWLGSGSPSRETSSPRITPAQPSAEPALPDPGELAPLGPDEQDTREQRRPRRSIETETL